MTAHAQWRAQSRGFDSKRVDDIVRWGSKSYSRGGRVFSMDKSARRRAQRDIGLYRPDSYVDNLRGYVVLSPDLETVITIAHKLRHFRKH